MAIHLLRYDDFSDVSCSAVEKGLADMLLRFRIPCTFAVVPFVCDPEGLLKGEPKLLSLSPAKAEILKPLLDAKLAEIALHGFSHLTLAPMRDYMEFSDRVPMETQRKMLQKGRGHLEAVFSSRVQLYVPPWNRLAATTRRVLKEEGLLLSGDLPVLGDADTSLPQLPCATGIGGTTRALQRATRRNHEANCVGTTFHDYDFFESGFKPASLRLEQFEAMLREWQSMSRVKHCLLSETIAKISPETVCANSRLRSAFAKSRLARRFFPYVREVFWNENTATRLAGSLRFLP